MKNGRIRCMQNKQVGRTAALFLTMSIAYLAMDDACPQQHLLAASHNKFPFSPAPAPCPHSGRSPASLCTPRALCCWATPSTCGTRSQVGS